MARQFVVDRSTLDSRQNFKQKETDMAPYYAKLNPLALAAGFGVATLATVILFFAPMGASMSGMHGYGMMGSAGYHPMGTGIAFLMSGWAVIVSVIAGAIAAAIYNSLLPSVSTLDKRETPKAQ